jgi:hypothetical protein
MSSAKNMKGISISARLESVKSEILPAMAAAITRERKMMKAGQ